MSADELVPVESMESWLANKPYWEQYLWHLCCKYPSLTNGMIEQSFVYLTEHLGLKAAPHGHRPDLSFDGSVIHPPIDTQNESRVHLTQIRDLVGVNALAANCSIGFTPHLTLIYGPNASEKSGVARLLANACFSRGRRQVLPDVKQGGLPIAPVAQATFRLLTDSSDEIQLNYVLGVENDTLKRFAVFDNQSVLIHLDDSNKITFSPAYVQVFDRVAEAIVRLEQHLEEERARRRKEDPFSSLFLDPTEVSPTSTFCKSLSADTLDADFLQHANFVAEADEVRIEALERALAEKRRLDVPARRALLLSNASDMEALCASLQAVVDCFAQEKVDRTNRLIADIKRHSQLVEQLGSTTFQDGLFFTTGSDKWKALLLAAKALHDEEMKATAGNELNYCLLCKQALTDKERSLFEKYWTFLESQAELELADLIRKKDQLLTELRTLSDVFPKLEDTHSGMKCLQILDKQYVVTLRSQFQHLQAILDGWISRVSELKDIDRQSIPEIDLWHGRSIAAQQRTDAFNLADPTPAIQQLIAELTSLRHRKTATTVRDAALEYLEFLRWSAKAAKANFAAVKMATTKKRREMFLVAAGEDYKSEFNARLAELGCDLTLTMHTSGDQGNTIKEFKLEYAEEYAPSQILSEGEQKICALADFLTEVNLDERNCGVIFDDPVTSLDHERKDNIAKCLVMEARKRQVIIFTHDVVFTSQVVRHSGELGVPFLAHWIRRVNGIPGHVKHNSSPKLANVSALKKDAADVLISYERLDPKRQEQACGIALDYLRSACEALIEDKLFAGTVRRYEDHVRVTNLEQAVFDQSLAGRLVNLHGEISELLLSHNRSDVMRENPVYIDQVRSVRKEFDQLEGEVETARKEAIRQRDEREKARKGASKGWSR